jgi:tRNA-dihydrouridine synthase A
MRFLDFHLQERPLALQLGGSKPEDLQQACRIAEDFAYDEINLNVGCPSPRVSSGNFGACLMQEPTLVSECISAMMAGSTKEITIKCRIGIDDDDALEFLQRFIESSAKVGCKTFIIHARKAWLNGLSPKENREIPPLHYERVHTIKALYPQLNIIINGGLTTLDSCAEQLNHCDGVMLGREAYNNPYILAEVDQRFFNAKKPVQSRHDIIQQMLPYIEQKCSEGVRLNHISRHILGLFNGLAGAKQFRRYISENAHLPGANIQVIEQALERVANV